MVGGGEIKIQNESNKSKLIFITQIAHFFVKMLLQITDLVRN